MFLVEKRSMFSGTFPLAGKESGHSIEGSQTIYEFLSTFCLSSYSDFPINAREEVKQGQGQKHLDSG